MECFLCFFLIIIAFLAKIFIKCFLVFFLDKNVLFSVECPTFPGKHYYSEGFWAQRNYISLKVCYSVLIS